MRRPKAHAGAPRMAHPTGATAVGNMRVRAITAVILLASITCVTWPWLDPRLDWSATFDGENHLIRLFLVGDALKAGD
ncbi:MAG: hypothetical protein KGR25_00275 [Chloroflexi bacterium]|nr:hypothetical protein [Chloroflexota bacterium]